jgi:hypothetical protein
VPRWFGPLAVLVCSSLFIGASPPPRESTYVGGAAAAAEWAWLPYYGDALDLSRHHAATVVGSSHVDQFVYHGRVLGLVWDGVEPSDGKFTMVEWPGGYGKGRIVYDYAHDLVLYKVVCCSLGEQVLARSALRPSRRLPNSDLSRVHTQRGIALGESLADVRRIDGNAASLPVPSHAGLRMLSYAALRAVSPNSECGQWQTFIFRNDRLISIELENGC